MAEWWHLQHAAEQQQQEWQEQVWGASRVRHMLYAMGGCITGTTHTAVCVPVGSSSVMLLPRFSR